MARVLWDVRVSFRGHALEFTPYAVVKETEKQYSIRAEGETRTRPIAKDNLIGRWDTFFWSKEDGVRFYADRYAEAERRAVAANEAFRRENYPLIAALPLTAPEASAPASGSDGQREAGGGTGA